MKAAELIDHCQDLGLSLRVDGQDLKVRGAIDLLTEDLRDDLKVHKPEILKRLRCITGSNEQLSDEKKCNEILEAAISDMPVTLEKVLASPLFVEFDLDQISKGNMIHEALRM